MTKIKRIILIISVFVGGAFLVLIASFFFLTKLLCSTDNLNEYKSPFGRQVVYQIVKDCGATTDFVTSLNLGFWGGEIVTIKGEHESDILVKWIDEENIIVNYTGDPKKIYNYKTEVSGIKILFKAGEKDLEIKCLYYECEEQSRQLEIQKRKEWCNFSPENKRTCDDNPGYETCGDSSRCHYSGPNT